MTLGVSDIEFCLVIPVAFEVGILLRKDAVGFWKRLTNLFGVVLFVLSFALGVVGVAVVVVGGGLEGEEEGMTRSGRIRMHT